MPIKPMGKQKEHFKIYQRVFNEYTLKTLRTLINQGFFRTLDYPISTGKEADVYRCTTKKGHVAAKIYRIETSNFKKMQDYIVGDPRFQRVRHSKRAIVELWCQKEFRNLRDLYRIGVSVPKPLKAMKNVLIMEFIGEKGLPASLLKDIQPLYPEKVIKTLSKAVKDMWQKAKLAHGDLNEFNIMILDDEITLFDVSQAVSIRHPMAEKLLKRDLKNIEKLAKKYKVMFNYEKILKELVE